MEKAASSSFSNNTPYKATFDIKITLSLEWQRNMYVFILKSEENVNLWINWEIGLIFCLFFVARKNCFGKWGFEHNMAHIGVGWVSEIRSYLLLAVVASVAVWHL